MAVEDEEPLTQDDQGGGGDGRYAVGQASIETILTSALHKHAAKKLGKKLNKKHKSNLRAEEEPQLVSSKKRSKKKKSKASKAKDTQESLELDVVSETKYDGSKRKSDKTRSREQKCATPGAKTITSGGGEGELVAANNDENTEGAGSPTHTYLRAVAVPKSKKSLRKPKKDTQETGEVLGITVHSADHLEGPLLLFPHPVVQVYICNMDTGQLLHKSSPERKVTSYYEGNGVDYILPIMTSPYDVKKARSTHCRWEEQLVINESLDHFTSDDSPVVMFFQLMDFPATTTNTPTSLPRQPSEGMGRGWVTFAWAFLKVKGANGHVNIGHQVRLQLWRPRRPSKVTLKDLHSWWRSGSRTKYPSTLHVTLQDIIIPLNPEPALRSMLVTQAEGGGGDLGRALEHQASTLGMNSNPEGLVHRPVVSWGRKPSQTCKIANSVKHCFSHTDKGCMMVKFSNDGFKLACGTHKEIFVYDVLLGHLKDTLHGHLGLIYDISWSADDSLLLTASADSTARVWKVGKPEGPHQSQVLTHPSYVYVAQFVPARPHIVVSGCYDHVLRVWMCDKAGTYSIIQELTNHLDFVSALCFINEGNVLFSGDKQGIIFVWSVHVSQKDKSKKKTRVLNLEHEAKISDIVGIAINSISSHPGGFRLLVHTRDSQLKLVNHQHWTVTHRLRGALNVRQQLRGCVSPCGTWVISGSEDGGLYVWNSDTGELTSTFMDLPFNGSVSCVDFHPHDHMMAVCSYSSESPVLILAHNTDTSVAVSVQPASTKSLCNSLRSQSPQLTLQKQSVSSALDSYIATTSKALSTTEKSFFISQEYHQSDVSSSTYNWFEGQKESSLFTMKIQDSKRGGYLTMAREDAILKKLDSVLRIASEEPLSFNTSSNSEKQGGYLGRGQLATVLYHYSSPDQEGFSLRQGDFVVVVEETNTDWWLVQTADGRFTGLAPASYLKKLTPKRGQDVGKARDAGKVIAVPTTHGEVSFISDAEESPRKARARRHRTRTSFSKMVTSTPKAKSERAAYEVEGEEGCTTSPPGSSLHRPPAASTSHFRQPRSLSSGTPQSWTPDQGGGSQQSQASNKGSSPLAPSQPPSHHPSLELPEDGGGSFNTPMA